VSQTEPASLNVGDVMETKTARTGVMRKTARAPKGCVTPKPSLPAKIQVLNIRNKKIPQQQQGLRENCLYWL